MRVDNQLSGAGALGPLAAMDRERAFLFRWRAGVDSRGLPVYLRKYYHTCCAMGGQAVSNGILENTAAFSQAARDAMEQVVEPLGEVVVAGVGGFRLVSQKGREWTQAVEVHRYLEHHQLGDQWR
jgi:hypothetical protein